MITISALMFAMVTLLLLFELLLALFLLEHGLNHQSFIDWSRLVEHGTLGTLDIFAVLEEIDLLSLGLFLF